MCKHLMDFRLVPIVFLFVGGCGCVALLVLAALVALAVGGCYGALPGLDLLVVVYDCGYVPYYVPYCELSSYLRRMAQLLIAIFETGTCCDDCVHLAIYFDGDFVLSIVSSSSYDDDDVDGWSPTSRQRTRN
mmetsp:Transcript_22776/g.33773  ORF Transcript_22776/g.33773 Transcript_22776/m.33773 type:complete len:132 (+) Transcript_22776:198-593(+)